jgi:predicted GNAT family N-acyltransferase
MEARIEQIGHGTAAYRDAVNLRHEILRKPLGLEFTEDQLAAEADQIHIAAYVNDEIVGCLSLLPHSETEIKMRQVAVSNSHQGKGIGQLLSAYAEDLSLKLGYVRVLVHARQVAFGFYESMDYVFFDEPFEEVGIPHRKCYKDLVDS